MNLQKQRLGDFGSGRITQATEPLARNPYIYFADVHTQGFEPHEARIGGRTAPRRNHHARIYQSRLATRQARRATRNRMDFINALPAPTAAEQ